jgi:4-hydroxy-2-oxoheptanedioate aldolase
MKSLVLLVLSTVALTGQVRIFNTVKTKLAEGKQVVGGTVTVPSAETYCAMANSGYDFTWIEMQHSPLTYQDVANMVFACKGAAAMPFVRVPDANEGDIQKAVDLGAVGIIIPMVEDLEKVRRAIRFAKYPPVGKRSLGGGNYGKIWGADYRQIANDNIMIVAMIESPVGVKLAKQMAEIEGVDVVFIASTDLTSFTGWQQGDPRYEALVTEAKEAILKAGKKVAGPLAWKGNRTGYSFFQAPTEASLIQMGVKVSLGQTVVSETKKGVAQTEGAEKH